MQGMPLKIDKKVLVGHELEIDELREKIGKFSLKNNPKLPEYTRLVSSSETDWDWDQVKTMLTQDPSTLAPFFSCFTSNGDILSVLRREIEYLNFSQPRIRSHAMYATSMNFCGSTMGTKTFWYCGY